MKQSRAGIGHEKVLRLPTLSEGSTNLVSIFRKEDSKVKDESDSVSLISSQMVWTGWRGLSGDACRILHASLEMERGAWRQGSLILPVEKQICLIASKIEKILPFLRASA